MNLQLTAAIAANPSLLSMAVDYTALLGHATAIKSGAEVLGYTGPLLLESSPAPTVARQTKPKARPSTPADPEKTAEKSNNMRILNKKMVEFTNEIKTKEPNISRSELSIKKRAMYKEYKEAEKRSRSEGDEGDKEAARPPAKVVKLSGKPARKPVARKGADLDRSTSPVRGRAATRDSDSDREESPKGVGARGGRPTRDSDSDLEETPKGAARGPVSDSERSQSPTRSRKVGFGSDSDRSKSPKGRAPPEDGSDSE
jgi:hypothetical protein